MENTFNGTPYYGTRSYASENDGLIYNNGKKSNHTIYSDRIIRDDYSKYNTLSKKHFGDISQWFSGRTPEMIENFLRDFCDKQDIVLCAIYRYENLLTGYPYWRFDVIYK